MTQPNTTEFDLDAFLGDLGVTDAAVKAALADEKVQTKLKESVLRQSDYDKKMNASKADVQKQVAEVAAKQESLNKLIELNTNYKGEVTKEVEKIRAAAQKEIDAANAKLTKVAKEAGYEDDELDEIVPKVAAKKDAVIDEEAILKMLQGKVVDPAMLERLGTGYINLNLDMDEIKDVYQDLYGKRLSRQQKEEVLKEYNADVAEFNKRHPGFQPPPIEATAARVLKFDEKRTEKAGADRKKLEEEIRADERRKIEAERMNDDLPGPRREGINSPLWNKTRKEGEKATEGRGARLAMEELAKQRAGNRASA